MITEIEILENLGFSNIKKSSKLDYEGIKDKKECLIEVKSLSRVREFAPITLSKRQHKIVLTHPNVYILFIAKKQALLLKKECNIPTDYSPKIRPGPPNQSDCNGNEFIARVQKFNRVTIPRRIRKPLQLKRGDLVRGNINVEWSK